MLGYPLPKINRLANINAQLFIETQDAVEIHSSSLESQVPANKLERVQTRAAVQKSPYLGPNAAETNLF
jgi:hypothetical protein